MRAVVRDVAVDELDAVAARVAEALLPAFVELPEDVLEPLFFYALTASLRSKGFDYR